jgi:UDP-N-acetylmuramoyl-tripeptide--D-alanyl-D-alanine ligase
MGVRRYGVEEIARITGGRVARAAAGPVAGLSLDSRRVAGGSLFACLKGERADGHDYAAAAVRSGAAAVLAEREVELPEGAGLVVVPSVERAVRDLGRDARRAFEGEVIGVVGSCGKTTTKDFAAALLAQAGPVCATEGNRNNLLGLPETLLGADPKARFLVLEMGISKPGEMEELAPIAEPAGVVFTTIQAVHTEFFSSLPAILEEKAKVLRWTRRGGFAALNADDPLLASLAPPDGISGITYGCRAEAEVRVRPLESLPEGTRFSLETHEGRAQGVLPLQGLHNLSNFAAAAAAAARFGVPPQRMAQAASSLKPAKHRGEMIRLRGGTLLFDDSYNSNPAAAALALATAKGWGRRLVAALGEMLELGAEGPALHERLGRLAAEQDVAALLAVGGDNAARLAQAFAQSGRPCLHVASWQDGAGWLAANVGDGDAVLVKGSRGIGLDSLVEWLRAEGED